MPVKLLASHKAHMEMSAEVSTVYQQLTIDLAKAHRDYKSRERRNEKDKLIHGSITEQKLVDLEGAKRLFEKLFAAVSGLADATGGLMPALEVTPLSSSTVPCLALPSFHCHCLLLLLIMLFLSYLLAWHCIKLFNLSNAMPCHAMPCHAMPCHVIYCSARDR